MSTPETDKLRLIGVNDTLAGRLNEAITLADKLEQERDSLRQERDRANSYAALCRAQFETANAAADTIDRERRALRQENARLRQALGAARDWISSNTNKPVHCLMEYLDSALNQSTEGGDAKMPVTDNNLTSGSDVPAEAPATVAPNKEEAAVDALIAMALHPHSAEITAKVHEIMDGADRGWEPFRIEPEASAAPAQSETHEPLQYETFVLLKKAIEAQLQATLKAQAELATERTRADAAEARLVDAQKDTQRLDWIEIKGNARFAFSKWFWTLNTYRESIDLARASEQGDAK